jgi:acyl carrier protein
VPDAATDFDGSTDLYEEGYVDSVGVVELLDHIRVTFGVELPESDLLSDDFSAIDGIARLIVRAGG